MLEFLRGRRLCLASGSPRRQELLAQITPDFFVEVSSFDEAPLMAESHPPNGLVRRLSAGKAAEVYSRLGEPVDLMVIGGDTVVVSPDGEIFGKPADRVDAKRMLSALSGRVHQVITGVSLFGLGREPLSFAVSTEVEFYPLTQEEINWYLDTGEPFDKAGAYGIQGRGGLLIRGISGDYDNVVGLPVSALARALAHWAGTAV